MAARGRGRLRLGCHGSREAGFQMAAPSGPSSSSSSRGGPWWLLAALLLAWASAPGALGSGGPARVPWELCEGQGKCCAAGPARKGSAVAAFCAGRGPAAALRGRCCLEGEAPRIVGLDLGNCSLQRLCSGFQEASTAIVIDLSDNPLEPLSTEAFRGFSYLETLVLPPKLDCPGGREGWNSTSVRGSSRVCQGQRNPCDGSAGLGWLCPEGSLCAPDGPGLPQCLCVTPFHGYKCLRQGTFPYLPFFGTLGAITATLCVLLWSTQRRKAKAS